MTAQNSIRRLAIGLLLTVAGTPVVLGGPATARKPADTKVPFTCFLQVWERSFEVVGSRYDKPGNRVIWTLRAKKDCTLIAYEAFVADPDGVQVDTIKVKFTPAAPKVKKGTRLEAVLPIGIAAGEPAKITIRERR